MSLNSNNKITDKLVALKPSDYCATQHKVGFSLSNPPQLHVADLEGFSSLLVRCQVVAEDLPSPSLAFPEPGF